MAYTKETWVDGTTAITAERLQNIEDGIEKAHQLAVVMALIFGGN